MRLGPDDSDPTYYILMFGIITLFSCEAFTEIPAP